MDIRHLRYFLAIAELGSITRAAAQLNVAQPALSLHVKNMEAELGTQLLLRSKSGVTPTEAGHLLMQRARAILDDLARTQDDIRTLESDPMGVVCIGLPSTISTILALPLIEAARKAYPRIRLNVAEAMSGFIADWLAEARDGAVEISRIAAPGFWRSAYLVYPSGRPVTRAREAVLALTEEVIDSLLQTGAWAGARPVARR